LDQGDPDLILEKEADLAVEHEKRENLPVIGPMIGQKMTRGDPDQGLEKEKLKTRLLWIRCGL